MFTLRHPSIDSGDVSSFFNLKKKKLITKTKKKDIKIRKKSLSFAIIYILLLLAVFDYRLVYSSVCTVYYEQAKY